MKKTINMPLSASALIVSLVVVGVAFTEIITSPGSPVAPTPANVLSTDEATPATSAGTNTTPSSVSNSTSFSPVTSPVSGTANGTANQNSVQNYSPGSSSPTSTSESDSGRTSSSSSKIETLGRVVEERTNTVDSSKEKLEEIINESVAEIIQSDPGPEQKPATEKIDGLREELLQDVRSSLSTPTKVTPKDVSDLRKEINQGIEDIEKTAAPNQPAPVTSRKSLEEVATTLDLLSEAISNQSEPLRREEADLLYKDSNGDGVSDYDSLYVHNLDPELPSPESVYEGRTIKAAEKILLGLDPTKSEIVSVAKESPVTSRALVVLTYKVEEVALTERKEIILKGQALPNSFLTLYIYSTPIIVTVKTDERGEWRYVLDQELPNGDHTVYTATVNNSGNIIAKSSPYVFTKTAEAATLRDAPAMQPLATNEPGLLTGGSLWGILAVILSIIVATLILVGMTNQKDKGGIGA